MKSHRIQKGHFCKQCNRSFKRNYDLKVSYVSNVVLNSIYSGGFRCNFKVPFILRGPCPIHKGNLLSFDKFSDNFSFVSEARSAFATTPPITLFILWFSNPYFFATWADANKLSSTIDGNRKIDQLRTTSYVSNEKRKTTCPLISKYYFQDSVEINVVFVGIRKMIYNSKSDRVFLLSFGGLIFFSLYIYVN